MVNKRITNKKSQIDLATKSFVLIVLVVLVSLFLFYLVKMDMDHKNLNDFFSKLEDSNEAFLKISSSPCFTVGSNVSSADLSLNPAVQSNLNNGIVGLTNLQAVFDINKIKKQYHREDSDLQCVEGIPYLIGFEIVDKKYHNKWSLGFVDKDLNSKYDLDKSDFSILKVQAYPIAIRYSSNETVLAKLYLYVYKGDYIQLYDDIKSVSFETVDKTLYDKIKLNNEISYNESNNNFCMGNLCLFASFGSHVNSFVLKPGLSIVSIIKHNNIVNVRSS